MSTSARLRAGGSDLSRYWRGVVERSVPAIVTLLLVAGMTAPLFASVPVMPNLGLLAVVVWASFQPGLMPPWLAFGIGIVTDLLFALPLGLNATLLPATVLFVRVVEVRFAAHRYAFDWLFATLVVVVFVLAEWQLLALAGIDGPLEPLLVQAGTTILAYPSMVALCARVQRWLQEG